MTHSSPDTLQSLQPILADAIRYWEKRRIAYTLLLTLVVAAWVIFTWPHFRPAMTLAALGRMLVLAVLANLCYCAAYVPDIAAQYAGFQADWRRWRWALWLFGTLFAALVANYLIADEIYPFVGG